MLPWALKPILGLLSDLFPICGYNKAPYLAGRAGWRHKARSVEPRGSQSVSDAGRPQGFEKIISKDQRATSYSGFTLRSCGTMRERRHTRKTLAINRQIYTTVNSF